MRIIRPSNSFIGERINSVALSHNVFAKKKKEEIISDSKFGNKTIGNLVVNSKKQYNEKKNPPSMFFATQIN